MTYTAEVVTTPPSSAAPELPTGRALHEHARASRPSVGNQPPEAFTYRRARIDALVAALEDERAAMRGLILEAGVEHGIGGATLARWSGYTHAWVQRVLEGGE